MPLSKSSNLPGFVIVVYADQTRVDEDKESGVVRTTFPDGHWIQRNPNGTTIEGWKDGHRIQTKINGERIEILANKTRIQTDATGETTIFYADGRTEVSKTAPVASCVKCPRCET